MDGRLQPAERLYAVDREFRERDVQYQYGDGTGPRWGESWVVLPTVFTEERIG
jgi:hypothetical protein